MENYGKSAHLTDERAGRLALIEKYLGYSGRVMVETLDRFNASRVQLLASGVVLILDRDEDFIITAYAATFRQAKAIYRKAGKNKLPPQLEKRIAKNIERHPELYTVK